jgi:pre-rRNA-processing protein TSR1
LKKELQEDDEFPDEVDTPIDIPVRQRYARYRALQSFRTSPWHPKENLPESYSKIFQFENFYSTQRG